MSRSAGEADVFLFNIYPSSFGRLNSANAVGLLVPSLVRFLTRKPVITYLHNIVESQDVASLGYPASRIVRLGARMLETLLLRTTIVFMPLQSQVSRVKEVFGIAVTQLFVPYVEAVYSSLAYEARHSETKQGRRLEDGGCLRVLLFGFAGPQKDYETAIRVLSRNQLGTANVQVTIVGSPNPNFPKPSGENYPVAPSPELERFRTLPAIPEEEVFELFKSQDVVILPYTASGGYSGVMNVAAAAGVNVIAYDLPQLRETACMLGVKVSWVKREDPDELAQAIAREASLLAHPMTPKGPTVSEILSKSMDAVNQLLRAINQAKAA